MITVQSVNIAQSRDLKVGKRTIKTGIFKEPATGAVSVQSLGLQADHVINTKHYGGPDQAVYLYRTEDYGFWSEKLGKPLAVGTFGENLTVSGLASPDLMVGDVLRFPNLALQVTAPRIPCNTLAARMGDKQFAKQFVQAARPGIYFRVIEEGTIESGEVGELIPFDRESISTVTFFNDFHRKLTVAEMRRYLELPIDQRSRAYLQSEVDKAG